MIRSARPIRSVLYVPGSNSRALEKSRTLPADAVVLDLEDAVAPTAKADAREAVARALSEDWPGTQLRIVRVNGLDTPWGADDLVCLRGSGDRATPDAVLLPKVGGPAQVTAAVERLPAALPVWAMMETPGGILNAAAVAAMPRVAALVLGTNDLAKELGCAVGGDRMPLMTALQTCVLAARAAGALCIDGVFNGVRDEAGCRAECAQGRALGMDGKTLIHPLQIALANAAFAPDPEEVDLARRRIAAFEAAVADGQGVAVVDGSIVENLHVDMARRTLAVVAAIAELEG